MEILYCNKCGKKLVADDFTRGRAHTFNHRQYCAGCLPQEHSGAGHKAQREETRTKHKPVTARATTAPPPPKSSASLMIGVGLGVAAIGVIAVVLLARPSETPPPEPVRQKPVIAAPAGPSKEKIAEELRELDGKVQKLTAGEQFTAAVDLLEEARKRYGVAEWVQALAKRTKDVQDLPAGLYPSLKERATSAQLRGALAEAQKERARVVTWGRRDLLEDLDKAIAAIIPREPVPAGATVLFGWPTVVGRYRLNGDLKDGAMVGVVMFGSGVATGWESGLEIFRVPEEGEARVVFTTDSPKQVLLILRAKGADGKDLPYNFIVEKPGPGRPQVMKAPLRALRDWNNKLVAPGVSVTNVFVRQEDPKATLKVHEIVIFATKP